MDCPCIFIYFEQSYKCENHKDIPEYNTIKKIIITDIIQIYNNNQINSNIK